jgi:hypothetical protein
MERYSKRYQVRSRRTGRLSMTFSLLVCFVLLRSFLDYLCVEFFTVPQFTYLLLFLSPFVASAAYGCGNFQKGINSIPLFALGNYLAENFFFVWVKYLGDPKNYYPWFTGNILNPDGKFGYDGSNQLLKIWPLNLAEYALVNL